MLTPQMLIRAYSSGIFPMADSRDAEDVFWVQPRRRGILPLDGFHVPARLKRLVRRKPFEIVCDRDFNAVVEGCAAADGRRPDTWINDQIIAAYGQLHLMGLAHSVECRREGRLVGGLYGVSLGGAFFGESMFSAEPEASKVALVHLAVRLRSAGYLLLDTQFVTDHLRRFGAVEIPSAEYMRRLQDALGADVAFPAAMGETEVEKGLRSLFSVA